MIKENCQVASYPYEGYWEDIGTIKSFFEANIALTDNIPEFNLHDPKYGVYTHPRMLPPTKLFGTTIKKALISEGSIIHAKSIESSVIGIRTRIMEGTALKNVIVFGNDFYEGLDEIMDKSIVNMGIGKNCHIENAIIDKDSRISDDVQIIGHDDLVDVEMPEYVIRDGIVVIRKGVIIPAGTKIGYTKKVAEEKV